MSDDLLKRLRNGVCQDQYDDIEIYETEQLMREAVDRIEELEAKLARAVEAEQNALSTLDAWFDRRRIGHDAVDQAVMSATSGYLRMSRSGGMSRKKSDLVMNVIEDMARLSVFADLFARATLTELKGEKE